MPAPSHNKPPRGFLVGPYNMAGQAWAWTKAVRAAVPGIFTESVARENAGVLNFECDRRVTAAMWRSLDWQINFFRHVLSTHSHVLSEAGSTVFSALLGAQPRVEEEVLRARSVVVGHVFHGSEIRDPSQHRKLVEWSPFGHDEVVAAKHQAKVDATVARLESTSARAFVTTVDLLDYVPDATWLPVIVREAEVRPSAPAMTTKGRPVFLHLPSNRRLKGSEHVDRVLSKFAADGVIDYCAPGRVSPAEVPRLMARADVVVDSLVLGAYGLMGCEAMQMGRLVVCNVERTRGRLPEAPPVVDADPGTLREAVARLLDDREAAAELAQQGPRYVRSYHGPEFAVRQLSDFLGLVPGAVGASTEADRS
jgi:hypothetical protein